MSSILSEIGLSEQLILSYVIGIAGAPAVYPYVRSLENIAWSSHSVMPPPGDLLAQGVAQGQVSKADAYAWGAQQGFGSPQMDAMVNIANVGMPLGQAYSAWRRGYLSDGQFQTQLNRLGIEPGWWPMLEALKTDRLDLGAIATAVHRGIMNDAGLLVTPVPSGSGNVPRIPVSPIDTLAEFAAQGIDPERARILVADTGLPLALGEMLQLYNRNVVTDTDVKVSIAESNVRNEYMDVALALARRLLTPHEYAEADLRGVMTPAEAQAGAALSGLNAADYATLFAILGRPISTHQVTTGLARGGTYGGDYTDVPAGPYRDAIRRSAIRPEYASLDYANRYTYPSGFQIKAEAPTLGHDQTKQLLLEVGWEPSWAETFATAWSGAATGAKGDPHVTKAQTQLWTATHKGYLTGELSDASATTALEAAGVTVASIPAVLALWRQERELVRKSLSAAQIKKAWSEQIPDPATGLAWTQTQAVQRLQDLGYSADDAAIFLDE